MQAIVCVAFDIRTYIREAYHRRVQAPYTTCPQCASGRKLNVLGYYSRYSTDEQGQELSLWIKRFICKACGKTLSCLPHFVASYRLLHNRLIEAYFLGDSKSIGVQRHSDLLKTYMKRFEQWQPSLASRIGCVFGRAPPRLKVWEWVRWMIHRAGNFHTVTKKLIEDFQTTCFGSYQCHQK